MRRSFDFNLVGWHIRSNIEGAYEEFVGKAFINLAKIFTKSISRPERLSADQQINYPNTIPLGHRAIRIPPEIFTLF